MRFKAQGLVLGADTVLSPRQPGLREVRWFFADKEVAVHTGGLFRRHDQGLERIEIEVLPYRGART